MKTQLLWFGCMCLILAFNAYAEFVVEDANVTELLSIMGFESQEGVILSPPSMKDKKITLNGETNEETLKIIGEKYGVLRIGKHIIAGRKDSVQIPFFATKVLTPDPNVPAVIVPEVVFNLLKETKEDLILFGTPLQPLFQALNEHVLKNSEHLKITCAEDIEEVLTLTLVSKNTSLGEFLSLLAVTHDLIITYKDGELHFSKQQQAQ